MSTKKQQCPHCGDRVADGMTDIYDCGTIGNDIDDMTIRGDLCYEREIERLRAIVDPLEKILGGESGWCEIAKWADDEYKINSRYCGATLAETLAKAAAELEGPKP